MNPYTLFMFELPSAAGTSIYGWASFTIYGIQFFSTFCLIDFYTIPGILTDISLLAKLYLIYEKPFIFVNFLLTKINRENFAKKTGFRLVNLILLIAKNLSESRTTSSSHYT